MLCLPLKNMTKAWFTNDEHSDDIIPAKEREGIIADRHIVYLSFIQQKRPEIVCIPEKIAFLPSV